MRKNKTFFFADWQGSRLRTGITRQSVTPTAAQRSGVFTSTIYDPASSPRAPFASNTIPASRFDPLASQVLRHYPLPNSPASSNFIFTGIEPDNQDQFDGRIDHVFSERHRAFLRSTSPVLRFAGTETRSRWPAATVRRRIRLDALLESCPPVQALQHR